MSIGPPPNPPLPVAIRQDTIRRSEHPMSRGLSFPARDAARDVFTPLDREPLPSEIEEAAVRANDLADAVQCQPGKFEHLRDQRYARHTGLDNAHQVVVRTGTDDTGPR